jgi:hypothetical protein
MTNEADMSNVVTAAQEQFFEAVRQNQQAFVDSVRAWSQAVAQTTPAGAAAPQVPENLPKPQELIDSTFDFAEKLLANQREFAHNVLAAASESESDS